MTKRTLFVWYGLSLLILIGSGTLQAQNAKTDWEKSLSDIVVLHNEGMLPLARLDTLQPFFTSFNHGQDEVLFQYLNKYVPCSRYWFDNQSAPKVEKAPLQTNINVNITAVHAQKIMEELPFATITKPSASHEILVLYGEGEIVSVFLQDAKATYDAIIYAPDNDERTQSQIAQILFGGLGASGRLPERLHPGFEAGTGLDTKGGIRLSYVPPTVAGMNGPLLEDSIAAILQTSIEAGAFPGAQVLVAKDGQVVYHKAFGYHTYANEQPLRTTDIYDLASVTKITSALAALMRLHGKDSFDLDAPLERYFPKLKRGNKDELTFRAMLAHNAQLRPWIPYWKGTLKGNGRYPWKKSWDDSRTNDYRFRNRTFARDSSARFSIRVADDLWLYNDYRECIYKAIRKSPLQEKKEYRYSGLLFYLLPEMVSDMTGRDYETYLKNTFYQPLGATTITYNPLRFFPKEDIVPTENDDFFRMTQLHGQVHDEGAAMMGGVSANAGLFASANDLAKLMQMYLNGGTYGGERFIAKEAVREFARCQYCAEGNKRGLGFDKPMIEYDPVQSSVAEAASPDSFGHSGYTGTFTWVDPANGLLFVFMSNRVYPTRNNPKIYRLNVRPRIHHVLYQAVE